MSRTSMDMTRGSLKKQILFFSIPLMLSNLLQVLFNMSDIAVIGQFAGAMSLGPSVREDGSIIMENNSMFCGDQVCGWSPKTMKEF